MPAGGNVQDHGERPARNGRDGRFGRDVRCPYVHTSNLSDLATGTMAGRDVPFQRAEQAGDGRDGPDRRFGALP